MEPTTFPPRDHQPRSPAASRPTTLRSNLQAPALNGDGRVLVVEHARQGTTSITNVVCQALFAAVQEVQRASSAWDALERIRGRPDTYCLVVMVHDRAGSMDAVEFARRARDLDPAIPVILASGRTEGAVVVAADEGSAEARRLPKELVRALCDALRGTVPIAPASAASLGSQRA